MRIISQNGMYDLPYEKCVVWIGYNETEINVSPIGEPVSNYTFAKYSTRRKLEKAMQLFHEVYIVHENFKKMDELQLKMIEAIEKETGLKYGGIFRFPKEEDL